MLRVNLSKQDKKNPAVKLQRKKRGESNRAWLARAEQEFDGDCPKVLLLRGTNVVDFRIRVAQSQARRDLKPSFWSHAAVYVPGGRTPHLWHVPFEPSEEIGEIPSTNAVARDTLDYCKDASRWQNLALLEFHGAPKASILKALKRARVSRLSLDLVSPLVQWLGYVWGATEHDNPLLSGTALPAATMVDAVFANADIDLAPGMDDRTLCPEAFWQSAKWWSNYYSDGDASAIPQGRFVIGQGAAAIED